MKHQTNLTIRNERRPQALRSNATDVEQELWQHLRGKQLLGAKFRRQHAVGNYIADFVAIEASLVIELDGGQHFDASAYDQTRDDFLRSAGFYVLRFWNSDVTDNLVGVLETIRMVLEQRLLTPSPPQPSP